MRDSCGPVRTQNMSNYKMSTQNIPNFRVCSTEEKKLKVLVHTIANQKGLTSTCVIRERSNKKGLTSTCVLRTRANQKSVPEMDISVNTSEVKDTKDEEPPVMDISLIKAPGYFKLFKYIKYFFQNLDAIY